MHGTRWGVGVVVAAVIAGCGGQPEPGVTSGGDALDTQGPRGQPEPPMLGIHWARGQAKPGGGGSPQLVWHGGEIMTSSAVQAVYWGPSWASASYQGDKVSGLATLYGGFGGSRYMGTNTEYTGTNGQVGAGVSYGGAVFDTSATPRHAPRTSDVAAAVCRNVSNPVANGYYPVYTDLPRGHAGYCAWHSYGSCNGVPVQFAFFFDLAGDPGCDPGSNVAGQSQALAALANVSGHELSEAVTDPRNGGWWDASGAENADKCAWTFDGDVTLSNGSTWKIQGNWSNAAYTAGTGYASGGCIQGN
ncbi:MAG: hypothetical protein QM704_21250 [Anaeromyxobacteraceae bacterium]